MIPKAAIGVLLLILATYGVVKAWPLLTGPSLTIDSPSPYTTYPDGLIVISGVARHTEAVSLNGGPLYIDTEGRFSTLLALPRGGSILSLTASDRFGRSVSERRTVYIP